MHTRALMTTVIATALMSGTAIAATPRAAEPPRAIATRCPVGAGQPPEATGQGRLAEDQGGCAPANSGPGAASHRLFQGVFRIPGTRVSSPRQLLAPGRCLTAVTYLRNNLLDLENAYAGENFEPLRRAVAREPSIQACAPRRAGSTPDALIPGFTVARVIVVA